MPSSLRAQPLVSVSVAMLAVQAPLVHRLSVRMRVREPESLHIIA
jgi:hypothetical protein